MNTSDTHANFITEDLQLASFLNALGYSLNVLVKVEDRGPVGFFVFDYANDLYESVDDYHDGCAEIEPRSILRAQARCRKKLFSALDVHRDANRNGDG